MIDSLSVALAPHVAVLYDSVKFLSDISFHHLALRDPRYDL
jgi:hypothetical protein